jgi:hypothetical protein
MKATLDGIIEDLRAAARPPTRRSLPSLQALIFEAHRSGDRERLEALQTEYRTRDLIR